MNTIVRNEVASLGLMGTLPPEKGAKPDEIMRHENLIKAIAKPVSDDEARILIGLLGADDCFGLASQLMHLIESAPGWPLLDCLQNTGNDWIRRMRHRASIEKN